MDSIPGDSGLENPEDEIIVPDEILEKVPEEERENVEGSIQRLVHQELTISGYSGPIPPPQYFEGYERVLPGSANRILVMAEKQQDHRMTLEKKVVESDIWMERLGLILGFVLAVIISISGVILLMNDKPIEGFVLLIGEAVAIVGTFVYAQNRKHKQLQEQQKMLIEARKRGNVPDTPLDELNKLTPS